MATEKLDPLMSCSPCDVQACLEEASQSLASLLDVDEIVRRTLDCIARALRIRSGAVLLINRDDTTYLPHGGFGDATLPPLSIDSPLVMAILETPEIHTRASLPLCKPHRVCAELAELGAEVLVPLAFNRRVHGLLVLGPKISEPYRESDFSLLRTLANQSAVAIENANAYLTIQKLNQELEAKVTVRTSELHTAYRNLQDTQAQLVHSEKMSSLGRLVAGVAHELNNPITFIYSGVGILEEHLTKLKRLLGAYEKGLPSSEVEAFKAEIEYAKLFGELDFLIQAFQEGATRVKDIVKNLRNFSRAEEYAMRQVDLREGLQSTVALVNSSYKHRVAIHLDLADVTRISGSPGHLNQVFMNLLVNACQAIADRGDVWVSLFESPEGVVVEVKDNGRGIPAPVQPQIFEPFFTTKPLGEGTGLGLSICHGIIEKHDGRIEVESTLGVGTTFRIVFPLSRSERNQA